MKKRIIIYLLIFGLTAGMTACKKKNAETAPTTTSTVVTATDLQGNWVYPDGDYERGITFSPDGKAKCVGGSSRNYTSWEMAGGQLTLTSTDSISGSTSKEMWHFQFINANQLELTQDGQEPWTLTRTE